MGINESDMSFYARREAGKVGCCLPRFGADPHTFAGVGEIHAPALEVPGLVARG